MTGYMVNDVSEGILEVCFQQLVFVVQHQIFKRIENGVSNQLALESIKSHLSLQLRGLFWFRLALIQLPKVEAFTLMSVSGVDGLSDPVSRVDLKSCNEDRISVSEVPMLKLVEFMALPNDQAFALLEDGELWKLRMQLLYIRGNLRHWGREEFFVYHCAKKAVLPLIVIS